MSLFGLTGRYSGMAVYKQDGMTKIKGDQFFGHIADDHKWKKYYIKWYGNILEDAYVKMPFTSKLIDSIPEIQSAMISVLEPGSVITPHVGPFRGAMRYHLGLSTPNDDNCCIKVDGIVYSWRDGEDILFDDTFIHEVKNNTNSPRFILFCDVKRPVNGCITKKILDWSCKIAKRTGKSRSNDGANK